MRTLGPRCNDAQQPQSVETLRLKFKCSRTASFRCLKGAMLVARRGLLHWINYRVCQ